MDNSTRTQCDSGSYATAVALPKSFIWVQLIVFYCLIGGVIPVVLSTSVWVTIVVNAKLRNRFFIIIGFLTFCRSANALQLLIISVYRMLRTAGLVDICRRRIACHAIHFWLMHGWTLEMCLLLTLVVDRCIAVTRTFYYRQLQARSALQLCLLLYVTVGLVKLCLSYVGYDANEIVQCINVFSGPSKSFNEFSQIVDITSALVILVIYVVMWFHVRRTVARLRRGIEHSKAVCVAMQRQLQLMPVLTNLVLMHCSLTLIAKALLTIGASISPTNVFGQQAATAAGGLITAIDSCTNISVLLITHAELRHSALAHFRRKSTRTWVSAKTRLMTNLSNSSV